MTAPRRRAAPGFIIFEGASRLDGRPIVAIIVKATNNRKMRGRTADRAPQMFIIPVDDRPDRPRPGACPTDCTFFKAGCYVAWARAPLAVWKAYHRGSYARGRAAAAAWIRRERRRTIAQGSRFILRFGAAGDPAALPHLVVRDLAAAAGRWTGYTHAWRRSEMRPLRRWLMASVETETDAREAWAAGWRTFRARRVDAPIMPQEAPCPADLGRSSCAACAGCDGRSLARRSGWTVPVHGYQSGAADRAIAEMSAALGLD